MLDITVELTDSSNPIVIVKHTPLDMSVSKETIRSYCNKHYVIPARARGDSHLTIRSAEVANALDLEMESHIVYEAIWTTEFEVENNLFRVTNSYPRNTKVPNMVFKILS
ncbi:MAG: hypothetical protein ABW092_18465 [Candidatus Thiodiazotropha sp.]